MGVCVGVGVKVGDGVTVMVGVKVIVGVNVMVEVGIGVLAGKKAPREEQFERNKADRVKRTSSFFILSPCLFINSSS